MPLKSSLRNLNLGALPLKLEGEGRHQRVFLLDQRHLPGRIEYFDATTLDDMCFGIKEMVVRGAPSIGVAAAFGLALEAVRLAANTASREELLRHLELAKQRLAATRPTAVNLEWALALVHKRAKALARQNPPRSVEAIGDELLEYSREIFDDTIVSNKRLADFGAELVDSDASIITHCNAGSLATCGWGTALGVIRSAYFEGKRPSVFVDETRPRCQGARLTMWELEQDNIPSTLICDSMAGHVMKMKKVDLVVVGADRIAANGDTANKIGTYNLAVLADFHKIPFYVAAPLSTVDSSLATGDLIPIEERDTTEVTQLGGIDNTTTRANAFNPAFDVTPARLIKAIITEYGVLRAPYEESIAKALERSV